MSELSLEEQFKIQAFALEIQSLNREQSQKRLISLYRQMLEREILYKAEICKCWGIPNGND